MAFWSQVKVCGCRLSLRPIGCTPARSVTQKHCCSCGMQLIALNKCYMHLSLPSETETEVNVLLGNYLLSDSVF